MKEELNNQIVETFLLSHQTLLTIMKFLNTPSIFVPADRVKLYQCIVLPDQPHRDEYIKIDSKLPYPVKVEVYEAK